MHFVCSKCKGIMEGTMDSIEKLCDEVETVNRFCYLGDRLNVSGGCEAAVTARVRIGWVRFRECGELLIGNRFPLRMKGKLDRCCVSLAILCGSEAWYLKEDEKAILRRMEKAMVRAMCGQKVVDRKTTEEQIDMLQLRKTIDWLATANGVRWYGHVLRKDLFIYLLTIFILHSRESELCRYVLDGMPALARELLFPKCLGHLSAT